MEIEIKGSDWLEKSKSFGEYDPTEGGKTYEQMPNEFLVLGEDGMIYKVNKNG